MITKIVGWTKDGSLERAILTHMYHINKVEGRPTSFIDFQQFEVYGKKFVVAHGTFRNKVSAWIKRGIVRLVFNSKLGFYALTGVLLPSDKMMTRNDTGISPVTSVTPVIASIESTEHLLRYLKTLDSTVCGIHDIHTKFVVPDIYKIMSSSPKYSRLINPVSKDIRLEAEYYDDMCLRTTIHRTDTVTVIVGCTNLPIILDERGITRLSCALTRVEERISRKLDECGALLQGGYERIPIPDYKTWQVTLWHFGKDKFHNEYPSKGYALTWAHGSEVLRCYIKTINGNKIERTELQECPNKNILDALNEKMREKEE